MEYLQLDRPNSLDTFDSNPIIRPSSAIHAIPNELLVTIFKAGSSEAPTLWSREVPFPILVSTICRHWRELAINAPVLWTYIHITSLQKHLYFLAYFERSKPCLFDVTIDMHTFPTRDDFDARLSSAIKLNMTRMRKLSISAAHSLELFQLFADPFNRIPAPNLQAVQLSASYSQPHSEHLSLFTGARALRSLQLRGICPRCTLPLFNLTHLDIYCFEANYSKFRDLFLASPSLLTLVLRKFNNCESPDVEKGYFPQIIVHSLRSMAISFGYGHDIENCACPLSLLSTPNLEYLEVQDGAFSGDTGLSTHFSSYPMLHTLRLEGLAYADGDAAFIRSLSTITHLVLVNVRDCKSLWTPLSTSQDAHSLTNIPWRELCSVTLVDAYNGLTELSDYIKARATAGYQCFTVRVPQTFEDESRHKLPQSITVKALEDFDSSGLIYDEDMSDGSNDSGGFQDYDDSEGLQDYDDSEGFHDYDDSEGFQDYDEEIESADQGDFGSGFESFGHGDEDYGEYYGEYYEEYDSDFDDVRFYH